MPTQVYKTAQTYINNDFTGGQRVTLTNTTPALLKPVVVYPAGSLRPGTLVRWTMIPDYSTGGGTTVELKCLANGTLMWSKQISGSFGDSFVITQIFGGTATALTWRSYDYRAGNTCVASNNTINSLTDTTVTFTVNCLAVPSTNFLVQLDMLYMEQVG